ncbi:hypothetical protein [Neptunicoccus cionae]|uniref:Glycine zipper domain-containing protein n=1 Tax=Neptunicoccus cionae TaxID=2035344 RepID=A0A916VN12_9RHOB|nr:hypothetical protein [Amylibacter cionae]GGA10470.1 hypothetical protein GCM10011498_08190 [Amylibacter cionae]
MAFRFPATKLIAGALTPLLFLGLSACAVSPNDPMGGQRAFSWQPETAEEKALRHKAEALQATVGEGGMAGFAVGALIGGLTGGMQGAFAGARLGRFIGAASGVYVRGLQEDFANREAQLNQLAADLEANNRDLESAIATMRAVLGQQRARLAAARASGNGIAIRQAQEQASGNLAVMNKAIEAAVQRQNVFGEARSLLAVDSAQSGATAPAAERYSALSDRISAMRSIATTLVSEI